MVRSGEITKLSKEVVQPYYKAKSDQAVSQLREEMEGLPFAIHKPEGALFLWLWFEGLPITCKQLYGRLKVRAYSSYRDTIFFPVLMTPGDTKTNASALPMPRVTKWFGKGYRSLPTKSGRHIQPEGSVR